MDNHTHIPDTQTDEELLTQFFAANTPQIADNGFTEDVLRRLPKEKAPEWITNLWIWLVGIVCIVCGIGYDIWKAWPRIINGMTSLIEQIPALLQEGETYLLYHLTAIAEKLFTIHMPHITHHTALMIAITIAALISLAIYDAKEKKRLTK